MVTPEELITGNHKLLERGYSPMTVRFFMLMGHYASTLDFSNEALQAAEKGLSKLNNAVAALEKIQAADSDNSDFDVAALSDKCYAAMNDDFNTPILIATLFEGVKTINSAADGRISLGAGQIQSLKELYNGFMETVLGLQNEGASADSGESIEGNLLDLLVELRSEAKANKDWTNADRIRNTLSELGITIKDSKEGSSWSNE